MSSTSLGITEHVSSWVDLQKIFRDVSSCTNRSPSMQESLIAFGFEGDDPAILPNRMAHSAGTDALRIIALLVNLLALSPDATLEIDQRPVRKWVGTGRVARQQIKAKNQFSGRPRPIEAYQLKARVKLNGGSALTMRQMADSFSKYGPSAIGIHGGKKEAIFVFPVSTNWINSSNTQTGFQQAMGNSGMQVLNLIPSSLLREPPRNC